MCICVFIFFYFFLLCYLFFFSFFFFTTPSLSVFVVILTLILKLLLQLPVLSEEPQCISFHNSNQLLVSNHFSFCFLFFIYLFFLSQFFFLLEFFSFFFFFLVYILSFFQHPWFFLFLIFYPHPLGLLCRIMSDQPKSRVRWIDRKMNKLKRVKKLLMYWNEETVCFSAKGFRRFFSQIVVTILQKKSTANKRLE